MSKFEVELELTGLRLRVRGDRQSVPTLTHNLGQQVASLFEPAASMIDENGIGPKAFIDADIVHQKAISSRKSKVRRSKKATLSAGNGDSQSVEELAVDFKHDPDTWGMPQQTWNTADKAMWLLYVLSQMAVVSELSSGRIAHSFNKHFRQSKTIQTGNVTRDLGKRKAENPSLVGQDTTKPDEPWYLTEAGIKVAEALVVAGKGPAQSTRL